MSDYWDFKSTGRSVRNSDGSQDGSMADRQKRARKRRKAGDYTTFRGAAGFLSGMVRKASQATHGRKQRQDEASK